LKGIRFRRFNWLLATTATTVPATRPTRHDTAAAGRSPPDAPPSATISGDGVSPAARAAASGSPPGSAAATAIADGGRSVGSFSRHRRITRSTIGSMSSTKLEGELGGPLSRIRFSSAGDRALYASRPVKTSYSTSPSE
jgi:hypothetical protein